MSDEQENQEFKVRDRRAFSPDREEAPSDEAPPEAEVQESQQEEPSRTESAQEIPLPEPSFSAFLTFFFFQQTLMFLGELPHPETQQVQRNLPMAKYLIDTMAIIKEKTMGNLSSEEQEHLDNFLTELRMRYVKAAES
jgi:hypothetical protein